MPLYDYKCKACGHADEEFFKIASSAEPRACPKCNAAASYERQISVPHSDMIEFHTPIEMFSIAMDNDDEIREFMRKAPDVQVSTDPDDEMYGIPVARSRKQKLAALKAAGYEEINSERVRN